MGFQGEGITNSSVIAVKSHLTMVPRAKNHKLQAFDEVVHVVRNPFHAIVAERKRLVAIHDQHTAAPDWTTFVNGTATRGSHWRMTSKLRWDAWIDAAMQHWHASIKRVDTKALTLPSNDSLQQPERQLPLHTVFFEELVEDVPGTMRSLLDFIGMTLLPQLPFHASAIVHIWLIYLAISLVQSKIPTFLIALMFAQQHILPVNGHNT